MITTDLSTIFGWDLSMFGWDPSIFGCGIFLLFLWLGPSLFVGCDPFFSVLARTFSANGWALLRLMAGPFLFFFLPGASLRLAGTFLGFFFGWDIFCFWLEPVLFLAGIFLFFGKAFVRILTFSTV